MSIIGSLATFELTCNTNIVLEGAAIWVLPQYVHRTLANALSNRMCVENRTGPIIASVRSNETGQCKFVRRFQEVVNYLSNNNATDQAIAKYDIAIHRYMEPTSTTFKQYAHDLFAKLCKVTDVCNKGTHKRCHHQRRLPIHPPYSSSLLNMKPTSGLMGYRV